MTDNELRDECANVYEKIIELHTYGEEFEHLVAFAKRMQAVGLREVEKMCDELGAGDAKSDYGIGYQNAMKEISVYCEQQAKEHSHEHRYPSLGTGL